jgi:RecB family exonuclease
VLAFIWNNRRSGIEDPDDLLVVVDRYFGESGYPTQEADRFPEDRRSILFHVQRALAALDEHHDVFSVEQAFTHEQLGIVAESVVIRSKIDLVLEHEDGSIEHVDYKTGKPDRDFVQEVMSRVALKSHLVSEGYSDRPIVTTTLFSSDGTMHRETYSREEFMLRWADVRKTIEEIHATETWRPKPGSHCRWCDFRNHRCSLWGGET